MKVLIAEDDPVSRRIVEACLGKWGYEVAVACDGAEAWSLLRKEGAPQVAILDWMMPAMDGLQLCQEIRKRNEGPYVYVILLTARGQKQDIVEGLGAGADDYLTKPFDVQELRARVRTGSRIIDLQNELIRAREALRVQATHDQLTGLWNRGEVIDILRRELARAQREGACLGIIMADLDHFKRINDTYGHLAGDAVLVETARRMCSAVRVYDAVGRYGGEEFLVVLPGCDASAAADLADRLCESINSEPVETTEVRIPVSVSLGVAAAEKSSQCSLDSLLRTADAALYRAKWGGRNRVEVMLDPDTAGENRWPGSRLATRQHPQ